MRIALIGHTGLVGTNLMRHTDFSDLYNSKNIAEIKGKVFDVVFCAGASGTKWFANKHPDSDWESIAHLINCLMGVQVKKFVLISTVDTYPIPIEVDETIPVSGDDNHHYGRHRYLLEKFVSDNYLDYHIIRLPIIFGKSLKKNMIFDLMFNHRVEFLDPNRIVQIYDLDNLCRDIDKIIAYKANIANFVTQPVSISEVASKCFGINLPAVKPYMYYNVKTVYSSLFGRDDGYLYKSNEVIKQIIKFSKDFRSNA